MPAVSTLKVYIDHHDSHDIVRIVGDASVHNVDELERQLRPAAAWHSRIIVVDLSQVGFISSLGLGVLIQLQRGAQRNGGGVRFVGAKPAVRDTIVKCRLDTVMAMFDTVADALAAEQS